MVEYEPEEADSDLFAERGVTGALPRPANTSTKTSSHPRTAKR